MQSFPLSLSFVKLLTQVDAAFAGKSAAFINVVYLTKDATYD